MVVPRGGRPQARLTAVLSGLFLVVALVVTAWGRGTWGTVFLASIFTVSGVVWWRIARTGIYVNSRGVRICDTIKRAVVVPWGEVVRFEAHPVHVPNLPDVGATISLVGSRVHPTPVKLARNRKFDVKAYRPNYDVVLAEDEFFAAVDYLNMEIGPHLGQSSRPDGAPPPPAE